MRIKKFFAGLSQIWKRRDRPEDRRRSRRIPVTAKVEYAVLDGSNRTGKPALVNYARNISEVGVCLITYEPLERGTRLSLRITLTLYAVLDIEGVVVWQNRFVGEDNCSRFNTGVKFDEVEPRLQRKLQRYLRHLIDMQPASSEQNFIPL